MRIDSQVSSRRSVSGSDGPLTSRSAGAVAGDEARIELAGPLEVEPRALSGAEAGVGQGAVVIADGFGGQGDASPEGVDRLGVAIAEEGALASIELGPQALGLQGDGAVERQGGRFEVAVAEQGAAKGVEFPRRARAHAVGPRRRILAPADGLGVEPPLLR